jgi:hypothetical protein
LPSHFFTRSGYSRIASLIERKMTPARLSSSRKVGGDADAVEHRVDRDLARAFDPGEHLLLLDRDAELLVDVEDLGIDLVEALERGALLGRGVIERVLVIDRRVAELGPVRLLHLLPQPERLEAPVEHPLGLVLLAEMKRTGVLVEALGRELGVDVGRPAVLVLGRLARGFARGAVLDVESSLMRRPKVARPRETRSCGSDAAANLRGAASGQCVSGTPARPRAGLVDHAPVRADAAAGLERAVVAAVLDARGQRDRALDRLDDVGQRDRRRRARELAARRPRRASRAAAGARQQADELLHGRRGQAGLLGQLGGRNARGRRNGARRRTS